MPAWRIIRADWTRDRAALRHVRQTVFVREQNVPADMEWDALDADAVHVLAVDAGGLPLGTGRLTREHAIGRMAVLAPYRGQNIGAALLTALVDHARALRYPHVTLHAQVAAIGFYERHGFTVHGDEFMEAGIRHRYMSRHLQPNPN